MSLFTRRRKRSANVERAAELLKDADPNGLASQVAQVYGEEVVRLRGAMQEALDALNDTRASREFNEARAREILRSALKYEGWLGMTWSPVRRPPEDAA